MPAVLAVTLTLVAGFYFVRQAGLAPSDVAPLADVSPVK